MEANKKALMDELQECSPLLAGLKEKKEGFTVPDNYFPTLQHNVLQQIRTELAAAPRQPAPPVQAATPWWAHFLRPRIAVGFATVIVAAGLAFFLFWKSTPAPQPIASVDLSTVPLEGDDVHQFIRQNLDDFDVDLLLDKALDDKEAAAALLPLSEKELNQYLDEALEDVDAAEIEAL